MDPRRELEIHGRVGEVSLSPEGSIWLTTMLGKTYFAPSIDGEWREGALRFDDLGFTASHVIERISFFDPNIAIATGYISQEEYGHKNKLYRTTDGGLSWEILPFSDGGGEWIYDVFLNEYGEAWMGGSEGSFLYSSDYGKTWERRKSPFDSSSRTSTIFMTSSTTGFVGGLSDAIKKTTNGGKTWEEIPTPFQQHKYTAPEDRHSLEKLRVAGSYLLVEQDGRVFQTRFDPIDWKPLSALDLVAFETDRATGQIVAVTKDLHLVAFDSTLNLTPLSSRPIDTWPVDLKLRDGTVFVIDRNNRLYRIGNECFQSHFPLTSVGPSPLMSAVRNRGDVLWGVTTHHIYNSIDGGKVWYRVGQVSFDIRGFVIKDDERILLWDGHGENALFDRESGLAHPIISLNSDDVIDIIVTPGMWVAYGGRQYETTQRIEVARTYFSGQFAGSRENGFVYVSRDRGDTWSKVDEWQEGGVSRVFVTPSGDMVLLSYLGSFRRLSRRDGAFHGENLIVADKDNGDQVPYVERANALYFADEFTGYVAGWIHHLGNWYFKTKDGGKTWRKIGESEFPYLGLVSAGDVFLANTTDRVVVLRGKSKEELTEASRIVSETKGTISDISVDDSGRCLLEVSVTDPETYEMRDKKWFILILR